jgi:hypothetical protein
MDMRDDIEAFPAVVERDRLYADDSLMRSSQPAIRRSMVRAMSR